jgi:RHS repeat-associated protein
VDRTGSLAGVTRHDYLPFGEELPGDAAGRTAARGYAGDNVRQRFTGYERDVEIGLDYARARYYSSTQGRFTSPDPLLASGRATRPQSWNRYSYVLNSPTRLIDPTGLADAQAKGGGQQRQPNSEQPPPPPRVDLKKEIPLVARLSEHQEGGVTVAAGAEAIPAQLTNAAENILQGVYNDTYYLYYPEAARNAVESRTGTLEPSSESVQRTQTEGAELQGTLTKTPSAGAKVGVGSTGGVTQTSTVLPRLDGEIDRRVTALTNNARAIQALMKLTIPIRHGDNVIRAPIDREMATGLVARAAGMGQSAATDSARNALRTVP